MVRRRDAQLATKAEASYHRMELVVTDTQASVEDIKDQLKRDRATFESRITAALEPFTSRMETLWRESALKTRISALEARRAP